jgi:hypothetical protein
MDTVAPLIGCQMADHRHLADHCYPADRLGKYALRPFALWRIPVTVLTYSANYCYSDGSSEIQNATSLHPSWTA